LASLGVSVVGVHFEGHGKSPRQRRVVRLEYLVDDVMAAVSWARERFACLPVLLGSSQGGILAMVAVARGAPVAGVVAHNVLDPDLPDSLLVSRLPRWLRHLHRPLQGALRLAARLAPRLPVPFQLYLDIGRVCREPWTKEQFQSDPLGLRSYPLAFVADLFTVDLRGMRDGSIRCPVVVIAGRGDPLFSFDYSRAVFERIVAPSKQLRVVETDHHLLFNECIDQLLDPVAADIETLASGQVRKM
jgi:alpha-beta hydrolase superfamily lysophospholipase